MGELVLSGPLAEMVSRNRVTADDVLRLRRDVFGDGVVARSEAEALFALDASCRDRDPSWDEFFIEALCDYLVMQEAPSGYVSEDNAAWLMRAISRDGKVDSRTELELLIKVMEKATSMPASLSAYALQQVAHVVMHGDGPLAKGRMARAGIVTADDVALMRRILYAFGGDGHGGVSREEAQVLFDINDHTLEAVNDPAWSDLFVKAIGFSLLAATRHVPVLREEALRREEWLEDTSVNVGSFFSRVFSGGLKGYADKLLQSDGIEAAYGEANRAFDAASAVAEAVDLDEAAWLVEHIGRDGVLHDNERKLIGFLKAEASRLDPALQPLLDKVA